jgi:hypothetical protein
MAQAFPGHLSKQFLMTSEATAHLRPALARTELEIARLAHLNVDAVFYLQQDSQVRLDATVVAAKLN